MRTVSVVKYVFAAVGIAMLLGAAFSYQKTRSFMAEAVEVPGTVIDLKASLSDGSTTYRPVVRFRDQQDRTIEFTSSVGSSPPRHARGDTVGVLYRPGNPQGAEINDFVSLWLGAMILGGLGTVFTLIGGGIILVSAMMRSRDATLRQSGVPIETDFQSVELNEALTVNGRHPFRVLTQWLNPATSEVHVFRSNNLWFDPTKYLTGNPITVYIARGNPKKYYVDLSFLPKLATGN